MGLSVPREWWSAAALLKSYEAAGFAWVQLHAPPSPVLTRPALARRHAESVAAALSTTGLRTVVHGPSSLRVGSGEGDRAFEGLLEYGAEVGAELVVYHACALPEEPRSEDALLAEARSLARCVARAERFGVRIAIENLAPVYPGPETVSASPLSLRSLARRIGSEAIGLCLDVGHANIVAELRHTSLDLLVEPVLDSVICFHVHDNFGARWRTAGDEHGVDPLRLDLHLPPGRGGLAWQRIAPQLASHAAPLILEVHPPYRPRAGALRRAIAGLLAAPAIAAAS